MTIARFRQISPVLYRGSAPSAEDVVMLNKRYGIKRIVSLDQEAGKTIDKICHLLGIEHIIIPINAFDKSSILKLFSHDLDYLFLSDKPTYFHCIQGKDRTGLAFAIYRCKYEGWTCADAYKEARSLGFGIGLTKKIINFDKKIIVKFCKHNHEHIDHETPEQEVKEDLQEIQDDFNSAYDIVSNTLDYDREFRDYTLDNWSRQSWSPYADYSVRQFPFTVVDKYFDEQYKNRQNYGLDETDFTDSEIPQVGQYDTNTQGINGAGPSMIGSGIMP